MKDSKMVLVLSGRFTMGSTSGRESDCAGDEKEHKVTLSRSFYIGKYEVTQDLYNEIMGENPSSFQDCGGRCPVENVSWYDAIEFLNKLSDKDGFEKCYSRRRRGRSITFKGLDCEGYRLPTEAEWEYAARGGGEKYKYAGSNNVSEVAWYDGNREKGTRSVGKKNANGFGLYDMRGNVLEWVWDCYGDYEEQAVTDPLGPDSPSFRVCRGGGWSGSAWLVRVSSRDRRDPSYRDNYLGFRISRTQSIP